MNLTHRWKQMVCGLSLAVFGISPVHAKTSKAQKSEGPRTALNSPTDNSCKNAYANLYEKGYARIRVVFGYKDTRPARFVGDRHERLAFVQKVLNPCRGSEQACGFSRDPQNADHFHKRIQGPNGKKVRVDLFIAHSSVGSDDIANRDDPFQKWQSQYAKEVFSAGVNKADVVLYNGHSRFGGGPDFEPPKVGISGEIDAHFYKTNRPGFESLKAKLRKPHKKGADGLKMLGLFSCASSQLFSEELTGAGGKGLITSEAIIYYSDALDNSLAALSSLLEMRCEQDFQKSLRHKSRLKGSHLRGFF